MNKCTPPIKHVLLPMPDIKFYIILLKLRTLLITITSRKKEITHVPTRYLTGRLLSVRLSQRFSSVRDWHKGLPLLNFYQFNGWHRAFTSSAAAWRLAYCPADVHGLLTWPAQPIYKCTVSRAHFGFWNQISRPFLGEQVCSAANTQQGVFHK